LDRDIVYAISRVARQQSLWRAPGDSLKRAMGLMIRQRVHNLPVMADGEPVGVVSIGDVAKYRLEDLETESNVLRDATIALAVAKPT
jgi:signal-transduction protein with cAMP-binding, CBS, and nucleotidyltransferase domain